MESSHTPSPFSPEMGVTSDSTSNPAKRGPYPLTHTRRFKMNFASLALSASNLVINTTASVHAVGTVIIESAPTTYKAKLAAELAALRAIQAAK